MGLVKQMLIEQMEQEAAEAAASGFQCAICEEPITEEQHDAYGDLCDYHVHMLTKND